MKPIPVTIARVSPEAGRVYVATSVDQMADAMLYQRGDRAVLVPADVWEKIEGHFIAAAVAAAEEARR